MSDTKKKGSIPLWAAIVIVAVVAAMLVCAIILYRKMNTPAEEDPLSAEETGAVSDTDGSAPADTSARTGAAYVLPDAA